MNCPEFRLPIYLSGGKSLHEDQPAAAGTLDPVDFLLLALSTARVDRLAQNSSHQKIISLYRKEHIAILVA
jgi:hypothetical protein